MSHKPKTLLKSLIGVLIMLVVGVTREVLGQPSDVEIKKQLTHPKTVSVTLGKPGTREWSSTYKKYVWNRSFTAKLKTEDPEIFVVVKGYASYDIIGGRFVFWRTFTTSNSYDGIPDPTAAEVQTLIRKFGMEQFLGNYYFNHVIGQVESIGLSDDPKFTWHTPNSVSFEVTAVYTERTDDIGGKERLARTLEIRLYRDNPKQEWLRMISTPRDKKVL
ncbi:MAG: hypothetical protein AABM67_00215 [Acidobacteriota bacterium]